MLSEIKIETLDHLDEIDKLWGLDRATLGFMSQPKKAVTAIATVKKIIKTSPKAMWAEHKDTLGISKTEFDDYYKDNEFAIGIEIGDVIPLDTEILLSAIKSIHPQFTPPQTFKYLDKDQTFRDYNLLIRPMKDIN